LNALCVRDAPSGRRGALRVCLGGARALGRRDCRYEPTSTPRLRARRSSTQNRRREHRHELQVETQHKPISVRGWCGRAFGLAGIRGERASGRGCRRSERHRRRHRTDVAISAPTAQYTSSVLRCSRSFGPAVTRSTGAGHARKRTRGRGSQQHQRDALRTLGRRNAFHPGPTTATGMPWLPMRER